MSAFAVVATLLALLAAQGTASRQAQPTNALSGCVVDTSSGPLPGTQILVWTPRRQFTTLTGGNGCYAFRSLPTDDYTLIAYLQGFQQVARTAVHIDNRAPVQHNRIAAPGPPGFEYLVRSAEVIEELKPSAEAGPAASRITFEIRFLRDQPTGRPLGYAAGDELIMFFEYWQSDTGVYRLYEDRPWVLAVDRGMVDRPFAGGGQMQLDELLETIRGIW